VIKLCNRAAGKLVSNFFAIAIGLADKFISRLIVSNSKVGLDGIKRDNRERAAFYKVSKTKIKEITGHGGFNRLRGDAINEYRLYRSNISE
jgi:hypothetical protein